MKVIRHADHFRVEPQTNDEELYLAWLLNKLTSDVCSTEDNSNENKDSAGEV